MNCMFVLTFYTSTDYTRLSMPLQKRLTTITIHRVSAHSPQPLRFHRTGEVASPGKTVSLSRERERERE